MHLWGQLYSTTRLAGRQGMKSVEYALHWTHYTGKEWNQDWVALTSVSPIPTSGRPSRCRLFALGGHQKRWLLGWIAVTANHVDGHGTMLKSQGQRRRYTWKRKLRHRCDSTSTEVIHAAMWSCESRFNVGVLAANAAPPFNYESVWLDYDNDMSWSDL